ncbi:MAG TPA: ABC transporter permease [Bryobacteraceae bacterium]|jgi:predicted permease|nr:ABC transporter permease [Bryobacteraceae bacterium]
MRPLDWLYTVPLRLQSLLRRRQADQDLDEELAYHIAQRTQEFIADGLQPRDARAAALREWRGVEQIKEECRDMRRVNFIQDLAADIRYGLRQLLASPGFTMVVAVSLALGIGANTAIFSLMDAVMFEMLPVKQPRQLVMLKWSAKGWPDVVQDLEGSSMQDERTGRSSSESFPYPVYEHFRDRNHVFSCTFAFAANTERVNVSMGGRAEAAEAVMVSGNYFEGLGIYALHGRTILPADDAAAAPPVAVLSHRFWQRRFGRDASVVGKIMAVDGTAFTIAGVAPSEFFGLEPGTSPDVFVPLSQYPHLLPEYSVAVAEPGAKPPEPLTHDARIWWLVVAGRMLPGVTPARAQAELAVLFNQRIGVTAKAQADPKTPILETQPASQGLDGLRRRFSRPLRVLMAMVGLVLLMACANAAGMLLARATARQREIAVRLSLGARRSRLIRQLLTESTLLAFMGGAAGVLLARWASAVLVAWLSSGRSPLVLALHLDARILAFTLAVSALTGILFGLAPAWRATRVDLGPALKQGGGSARTTSRFVAGRILVAGQIALCLLLLVTAGLFLRTLGNLEGTDLGFRRDRLLQFSVLPGLNGYQGPRLAGYYEELERRIQSLTGVRSVGLSGHALVGGGVSTSDAVIPGYTSGKRVEIYRNVVGAGFFETLGIPVVFGRTIEARDGLTAPKVAVVNEKLVRQYFHGDNPIGRMLSFGDEKRPRDFEIVGVVKDAKYNRLRDEAPPTAYMSYLQEGFVRSAMTFEVRAEAEPAALVASIRQEALTLDKNVPLTDIKTQTEAIAQELVQERVFARLASLFGGLALTLACVGVYGAMAYTVTRRTNEIGIRMAIGAAPVDILRMVLRESGRVVLVGSVAGLIAAVAATRVIRSELYGLSPHDPFVLTGAALVLVVVTMLAAYIPARRASRVDPLHALRNE